MFLLDLFVELMLVAAGVAVPALAGVAPETGVVKARQLERERERESNFCGLLSRCWFSKL